MIAQVYILRASVGTPVHVKYKHKTEISVENTEVVSILEFYFSVAK